MKSFSAKSRITFGLVCLLVSVLSLASMIGVIPDPHTQVQQGRAHVCETLAITSSDYISRNELRRLEYLLESVVKRNDDILSAGVRQADGTLLTNVANHQSQWLSDTDQHSTNTHVQVPIRAGSEKWGSVELRFRSQQTPGLLGWLSKPLVRTTGFIASASYLAFLFYLGKMLSHLNPSQTVPKRVRSALDSLAEGLFVIDRNGRIVLANKSFACWVNRDPEKLVGMSAASLPWRKGGANEPLLMYPWLEALRLEMPQAGIMVELARKNEVNQVLMANASPVLGHDGKYRGVLVSFDDVTQLEKTRQALREAKSVADEANQAKSEFLARMSHEIRTPMNAILGYTDVLRRGFDESAHQRHEYLDTIHSSGEHLLALINDILDLSKIEAGRIDLELAQSSPHQIIQRAVAVLRGKAEEKHIALNVEFDSALPETILTDKVRLHQTIVNLVGNAIKFTSEGAVTVRTRLVNKSPSRPQMVLEVIDTGIGMPLQAQEKIFEPFSQADSSVTRRFGGTGLGLAICKQLAEALGGGVSVSSVEGKGSTFTVTIDVGPLEGIRMVDAHTALDSSSSENAPAQEILQLPPARILAADDGASNRKLIELVLTRAGVEVVSVENGKLALDRALAESFDIILLDMQMPVMDGYTAATRLREAGCELPIIAMTAHAMQGDEEKCRAAGCSGFMTKPIKIDLLLSMLSAELGAGETKAPTVKALEDQAKIAETIDPIVTLPEPKAEVSTDRKVSPSKAASVTTPRSPVATSVRTPLHCSLPLSDPDFRDIAEEFRARLTEKMELMLQASQQENDATLASLAHWLKGSGGTAGFEEFTAPAGELEKAAQAGDRSQYMGLIAQLVNMAARIELSLSAASQQKEIGEEPTEQEEPVQSSFDSLQMPLHSSLPTYDPE